jgi:AcrR family transcriptional regulator
MDIINQKKGQIVDAAKDLFTRYGYKKVSMDEIAKEANVVKSTIYQYFEDKDDLFNYFVKDEILKMKDIVENVDKNNINAFEKIHRTIYELLMYRKNQQFLVTITKEAESTNNQAVSKSMKEIDKCIIEYVENKINSGIEKKILRKCNAKIISFILFKSYVALAIDWDEENGKIDEKEISDNISLFLKTGLII